MAHLENYYMYNDGWSVDHCCLHTCYYEEFAKCFFSTQAKFTNGIKVYVVKTRDKDLRKFTQTLKFWVSYHKLKRKNMSAFAVVQLVFF